MSNSTMERTRTCSVCGEPITERNKTGICARTFDCRSALQGVRHANAKSGKTTHVELLLPPAYELEDEGDEYARDALGNLIEMVDETAIRIAVSGVRCVPMTERERRIAVQKMIDLGYRLREIAANIGTSSTKIRPVIEGLGYELIPRRHPGGHGLREATEIRKIRDEVAS
jgi:hypothetical protein